MYTIILTDDKELIATQTQPVYVGENLSETVQFILPATIEDVKLDTATVFLSYVKQDGTGDLDTLTRIGDYDTTHYSYCFPIDSKVTKHAGNLCMWLIIYSGSPCSPTVTKSSEYMFVVSPSRDTSDMIDSSVTAIYKLKAQIDDIVNNQIPALEEQIPDDLSVVPGDPNRLHLSREDEIIGDGVACMNSSEPDDEDGMIIF